MKLSCLLPTYLIVHKRLNKEGVFFFGPSGYVICMTNPAHGVLNVSGRRCQISIDYKTLFQLLLVHGISFGLFLQPQQTVGLASVRSLVLTPTQPFLKRWGLLPVSRHPWITCTVTSDEQTCPGSEPPPPANDVNPRVPQVSLVYFGPLKHA